MSRLQIKARQSAGVGVLELSGRLTLGDGDEVLRDAVADMMAEDVRTVVLNLRGLTYSDSAGIGEMIAATTALAAEQRRLVIADPSPKMRDLLGRFPHVLHVVDSQAEAMG